VDLGNLNAKGLTVVAEREDSVVNARSTHPGCTPKGLERLVAAAVQQPLQRERFLLRPSGGSRSTNTSSSLGVVLHQAGVTPASRATARK